MKIAMFGDCFYPRINGVTISMFSFARELIKCGNEVVIVCPNYATRKNSRHTDDNYHSYLEEMDIGDGLTLHVYRAASHNIIWSDEDRYGNYTSWFAIKDYLNEFKPDVIHVQAEYGMGHLAVLYSKVYHLPLVYTFHTYWEEYCVQYAKIAPRWLSSAYGRGISYFILSNSDCIITPTNRFKSVVKRYGFENNVFVNPTGISPDIKVYDEKKAIDFNAAFFEKYPSLKNKNILLYVGRVTAEKNLFFLFDMLEEVRKTIPNTALLVIGDGLELQNMKDTAAKLPYSEDIVFTGYCDRKDLSYYYKLSKVFVFPSMTETQGLVTLEAMTFGLPVVAIGEMGTLDVMQGNHGGFMVKNDVHEFSEKVIELIQNKEVYKQMSDEGKEWCKKWSMEETTQNLLSVYEKSITVKKGKTSKRK